LNHSGIEYWSQLTTDAGSLDGWIGQSALRLPAASRRFHRRPKNVLEILHLPSPKINDLAGRLLSVPKRPNSVRAAAEHLMLLVHILYFNDHRSTVEKMAKMPMKLRSWNGAL
jgi:hypothetical protein